jgi:hypothetical protein
MSHSGFRRRAGSPVAYVSVPALMSPRGGAGRTSCAARKRRVFPQLQTTVRHSSTAAPGPTLPVRNFPLLPRQTRPRRLRKLATPHQVELGSTSEKRPVAETLRPPNRAAPGRSVPRPSPPRSRPFRLISRQRTSRRLQLLDCCSMRLSSRRARYQDRAMNAISIPIPKPEEASLSAFSEIWPNP